MWRFFAPRRLLACPCPSFHLSSSSSYSSRVVPPSFSRRQKNESRNLRVSVWWDFEDCGLPTGVDVREVVPAITKALRANGIRGPVEINAFGDTVKLASASPVPLDSTAINFNHTLPGRQLLSSGLLANLLSWVSDNPPPAHLFLISSDSEYAGHLNRLRMRNYNILLASIKDTPDYLRAAASVVWNWNLLVKRENLIGMHVNCPPCGSIDSRQYKLSRSVEVLVFWDFEGCNLPAGVDVVEVAPAITAALRANGIYGPIEINAFGDVLQLMRASRVPLFSTGIAFIHILNGYRSASASVHDRLIDIILWNKPPAHLFVICGTDNHSKLLHYGRMKNYNILFASNSTAPVIVRTAASIVWHWHLLLRGENLVGTHFNYPPDGPNDSWYGHFDAPIEDPFSTSKYPALCAYETKCFESGDPQEEVDNHDPKSSWGEDRCK